MGLRRPSLVAAVPLLLFSVGCVDDYKARLVNAPNSDVPKTVMAAPRPARYVSKAPATEETARRVIVTGQKIIDANPQIGMRPLFITVGVPHAEVFHQGGGTRPYQVYVSEGLANKCATEAELAAVLSLELGKMVAEREAATSATVRRGEPRVPPMERLSNDDSVTKGSADGMRLAELARYDAARRREDLVLPPPVPESLARTYLSRAGIAPTTLANVKDVLREAEENDNVERQLKEPPGRLETPPVTLEKPTPVAQVKPGGPNPIAVAPRN